MSRRRILSLLCVGAALAALAIAWLELAPRELGGKVTYVLIDGSSMSPALGADDLAVVRPEAAYEPGDIVAYRSEKLDRIVLHRIVSVRGDSFVTQGDANDYLDPDRPTSAEVIGKLWITVPYGGAVLGWLRVPLHAALVTGIATLLLLAAWVGLGPARRGAGPHVRRIVPLLYGGLGCLAAAALVLELAALVQPTTRRETVPDAYRQLGTFGYSGVAPPGATYPLGKVGSGEPVFLELVDRVNVTFAYRLAANNPVEVAGAATLTAVVTSADGWQRRLTLTPTRAFADDQVVLSGALDLGAIQSLLTRVERETGLPQETAMITVEPEVAVSGAVAGTSFEDAFSPRLALALDAARLAPVQDPRATGVSLTRTKLGTITRSRPNEIGFLGVHIGVTSARVLAGAVLAAVLVALALLVVATRSPGPQSEAQRIARRYGRLVVPIGSDDDGAQRLVGVPTIDALLRIAEAHGTLLLQRQVHGADEFLVETPGTTYRYSPAPSAEPARARVAPGAVVEAR